MHGETIQEDQGQNLKQPKLYKDALVLYLGGGLRTTQECCHHHDLPHDPAYRVQTQINTI
jgi:hypothetical protein